MKSTAKTILLYVLIIGVVVVLAAYLISSMNQASKINYDKIINLIYEDKVESFTINGKNVITLKTVSGVLWENCSKNGTVYRVGGDEFMIIYTGSSEDDIKAAVDVMKSKMAKTDYVCAFGYAMKARGEKIDDAIRESDARMYEDKAATKKARLEAGQNVHDRDD